MVVSNSRPSLSEWPYDILLCLTRRNTPFPSFIVFAMGQDKLDSVTPLIQQNEVVLGVVHCLPSVSLASRGRRVTEYSGSQTPVENPNSRHNWPASDESPCKWIPQSAMRLTLMQVQVQQTRPRPFGANCHTPAGPF